MGYAGNTEPDYIIPSVIGLAPQKGPASAQKGAEVCYLFFTQALSYSCLGYGLLHW